METRRAKTPQAAWSRGRLRPRDDSPTRPKVGARLNIVDAGNRSEALIEESGQAFGGVTIELNGEAGVYLDPQR
jgi:hypothetical protein